MWEKKAKESVLQLLNSILTQNKKPMGFLSRDREKAEGLNTLFAPAFTRKDNS